MREADAPKLLRSFRAKHGLSVRDAGARIVVEGKPVDGATWHGWEAGKIPKPAWMFEIERVTGIDPSSFYRRPDASGTFGTLQPALL